MKTQEEIEQLADKKYLQRAEAISDSTIKGYIVSATKGGFIDGYTQCQEDMLNDLKLTRFEVIDNNGRVYSQWNCKIELSYQDDGKTLKVFINSLNKQD